MIGILICVANLMYSTCKSMPSIKMICISSSVCGLRVWLFVDCDSLRTGYIFSQTLVHILHDKVYTCPTTTFLLLHCFIYVQFSTLKQHTRVIVRSCLVKRCIGVQCFAFYFRMRQKKSTLSLHRPKQKRTGRNTTKRGMQNDLNRETKSGKHFYPAKLFSPAKCHTQVILQGMTPVLSPLKSPFRSPLYKVSPPKYN